MCLSGLQSVNGLSTWGATIIQSLGFNRLRANLLNAPGPILGSLTRFVLSSLVDRYKQFGYATIFAAIWTLAGLIALYVSTVAMNEWTRILTSSCTAFAGHSESLVIILCCLHCDTSRSVSPVSATEKIRARNTDQGLHHRSWQPINVSWLALDFKTSQKRAIAYAVYSKTKPSRRRTCAKISSNPLAVGCSNLAGTYGNQVFRGVRENPSSPSQTMSRKLTPRY